MLVVITGGAGRLGQTLAASLRDEHQVRTVDVVAPEDAAGAVVEHHLIGDLRDSEFAKQAVAGADAIVHLAPIAPARLESTSDNDVLDAATRGTYYLLSAAAAAGIETVVLGSTLGFFDAYPAVWRLGEGWRPRPAPRPEHLGPYLAEVSASQFARVERLRIVCLRFGQVVDDDDIRGQPFDSRWLHLNDALQALRRALTFTPPAGGPQWGWWVYHIGAAGPRTRVLLGAARGAPLNYTPEHDFHEHWPDDYVHPPAAPALPHVASRPIRKVVVFGAGGPLAAAAAPVLAPTYALRLTDLRPLADIIAENKPQSPGAPLPTIPDPPHEVQVVDITDPGQVLAACEGVDAIVNCTVNRPHPVEAFRVNCLGAYNVMKAAVAHGIRRVVHTGPQMVTQVLPVGYAWDFDVTPDVPPRPGTWLYGHTKYLGHEVCRIYAEAYGLEVPSLYFSSFVNPRTAQPRPDGTHPFSISWEDAGIAIRRALEVPTLPRPFEVFFVVADLPHGKIPNDKVKRLLGWQPRDNLEHLWGQRD